MWVKLVVGALAGLGVAAGAAFGAAQSVSHGDVRARITWDANHYPPNLHLTIRRSGETVFSDFVADLRHRRQRYPAQAYSFRRQAVQIRRLDRGGEPEVVLLLWWGGAHCCFFTRVYRYDPDSDRYRVRTLFHGDLIPTYKDRERDGRTEIWAEDWRFAYAFTGFSDSVFPIRIYRYAAEGFDVITRRYKHAIRRDARRNLRIYRRFAGGPRDVEGALAAYVADQYLLGRRRRGWRKVQSAQRAGHVSPRFDRRLRRFLRRKGYG